MADKKITDLVDGGLPQPTDEFVVARGVTNNKIAWSSMSGGAAQTAISGIANSQTTYTSGTVSLSEMGAITIRSSLGQQFQFEVPATSGLSATGIVSLSTNGSTISIGASQSVQTQNAVDVTLSGNTAGALALVSSGTLTLAGGNNITVSQAGNAITISGANAAGAQTGISGISASDTLYTSGSVRFTGSNAVTVRSGTGQLVVIDVPTQTTQVETQTFIGGLVGSNATYTSGTVTITGVGGGVTVSSNTGQRIDISVAAPVAQTNQAGSVYASSNTFGTSSGTYDARSISIAGRGAVSVAASNSGWIISAPAQTAQSGISAIYDGANSISTGTVSMANANGVSFSVNANTLSASVNQSVSMFAVSNTTQSTSGTAHKSALSFAGAGGVSVGVSGGSVVISGGAGGGFSGGVSTGGNTAGATGITGTQNVFVGVSPISLSQTTGANGGTISINAPATSSLSATGQVSISTNGSTISIGAPNAYVSYYEPPDRVLFGVTQGIGSSGATNTTVTAFVMPFAQPQDLAFNNVFLAVNNSFSSQTTSISSINYSYSMGASLGFYTLNASTMSLVTSFSGTLGYTNATSANATDLKATGLFGAGGSQTQIAITHASNISSIMQSIAGIRKIPLAHTTVSNTLTRGQYWAVACFSANTGGANQASLTSIGYVSNYSALGSNQNPPAFGKATASITGGYPFFGQATLVNSSNNLMPPSFEIGSITLTTASANSSNFGSLWMQIHSSYTN